MAGLLRAGPLGAAFSKTAGTSLLAPSVVSHAELGGVRNGAKLKEVKGRIRSVKNIGKITKTMKMIASARLREAQTRMEKSRPFAESAVKPFEGLKVDLKKNNVLVSIFSDRGLCGGLNGNVGRLITSTMSQRQTAGTDVSLVGMGDKAITAFGPTADKVAFSYGETSKRNLSFFAVSEIADQVIAKNPDSVSVMFNKFHSVISMKPEIIDLPGYQALLESPFFDQFEFEDDNREFHLQDVYEYTVASSIFGGYTENMASELGSRMTAMDNATRNAGDMLKKLEIWYNRGRQAAITTELTEIISGAAAVE
eukprot:TRINITY_DN22541_c0_g1_i1.p1 TRINITY_DN22541_c0_g1~~TRINITY_DN22541_c0_g1_i1.p1  ORF type:complete len:324 (-),score=96.40 TRINITY_DN22541_c0_g1_i1:190-1119(-)